MIRISSMTTILCVLVVSHGGCAVSIVPDSSGGNGQSNSNDQSNNNGSSSSTNDAKEAAASRVVMAVIAARNEDRRAFAITLRVQIVGSTSCPFGGSRSTGADGITTFVDCGMFPGITLNGGIRFTPGPTGTQGGRVEFLDLEGTNNGNPFSVDGTIEETENPDGSLSFEADIKTSQTGDSVTDEFNFEGEFKVNEDGSMEGNLRVDTGEDDEHPNDCDFNGFNIFSMQEDENAILGPCGFNEEELDDDENDDDENPECDCAPSEECIEIEGDDGTTLMGCSNCETNEDCVRAGLGNLCYLGFTCTSTDCETSADCPDGFECDVFLGVGECVEKSFFPFPL
ncbi:MAG: hypothetical protein R3E58_19585 [Phycisphaerae bacterium]|nr:hypothetical protein [Phycisphaerales bacterium]